MSEENPYQAPQTEVIQPKQQGECTLVLPKARPAGSGWRWISEAFSLFVCSPWMWILMCLLLLGMSLVISFIPLGSMALSLFAYVLLAGMMLGCAHLESGGELSVEHLFKGFKHEGMGALVICGAVVLGVSILMTVVILIGGFLFAGMAAALGNVEESLLAGSIGVGIILMVLVGIALTLPLVMLTWFAPALIVFHNLSAWDAMKQSFMGCLKNIIPFLVYGLLMLVISIAASIPLGLGWLVLAPVMVITMYSSYKEVFTEVAEPE